MSDKPIDINKSRQRFQKKRDEDRKRSNDGIIRSMGKNTPPRPPTPKIPEQRKHSDLNSISSDLPKMHIWKNDPKKSKDLENKMIQERLKQVKEEKRRMETQDYMAIVLKVAQEVYIKSQPQLAKNEEERLAIAERSIQAGQAFYKIAKEFVQYVKTEDLINDLAFKKD